MQNIDYLTAVRTKKVFKNKHACRNFGKLMLLRNRHQLNVNREGEIN
jgi:hypothetical protein